MRDKISDSFYIPLQSVIYEAVTAKYFAATGLGRAYNSTLKEVYLEAGTYATIAAFQIGAFSIEPARNLVRHGNDQISLEPKIMDVLCALAAQGGDVMSRDALIDQVWGVQFGGDESLSRAISILRKTFVSAGESGRYIETIAKRGYRLVQPVSGFESEAKNVPLASNGRAQDPDDMKTTAAVTSRLLAVLAFDNLSDDPELGYFCDGVSDEIQRTVVNGSELKVVARSSSFQFRDADKNVDTVAKALGVSHVLDGTVRRSGSRIRISAELVDCSDRRTVWADRFDGNIDDMFTLQDSIAAAVLDALKIAFSLSGPDKMLDPAIYELFLQARGIIAEGDPMFDGSAINAIPHLEKVTRSSPEFAPAWELLANSRAWLLGTGRWQGDYEEGRKSVNEAAEKALQLDPKRSGAIVALAMLKPWGAYVARENLLKRALEISPHDPVALNDMCTFCWGVGRFHDALRFAERACELNPLMPSARLQVAQMRAYVGDYEACIRMHEELLKRWPQNVGILLSLMNCASTLGFWDAYDQAVDATDAFEGWQAADLRAARKYADALRSGDPVLKAELIASYTAIIKKTGTLPLNAVVGIGVMGMTEEAWGLAEMASYQHIYEPEGSGSSGYYPGTALGRWSTLNKSTRFVALCNRLGLCGYWTESENWPDCIEWTPYDFKAEVRRQIQNSVQAP